MGAQSSPGPAAGWRYVAGEAGVTIVDGRAGIVPPGSSRSATRHLDKGLPLGIAVDQVTGTAYVGTRDHAMLFRIDAPTDAEPRLLVNPAP